MYVSIIVLALLILFLVYSYIPSNFVKIHFFKRKKENKKDIYLTFDDGPSNYTEELLNVLDKYNVKATFFCVADFVVKYKNIIERMKRDGHAIGLHSLKHKNFMFKGLVGTKLDVDKSLKIMKDLGVDIEFYRPPWGDSNLYLLKYLKIKKIKMILWDVMAEDWEANTSSQIILDKLLTRVKNSDIICLHDGRGKNNAPQKTVEALKQAIPKLIEKGYKFKTING